ncbi:MAG: 30S ribosomal protein S21 [Candidatus Marinimicrobia bacterium]|nr:30S ribosomal protein S21 [Candidatus Neomarinimicrobiota bacterium]MBT3495786.1 30S ribosomal protein S21 [Candidatus Neomarinimicrobiota bacterium]MBT3691653.1 30S ribosomal protein S21 [Candidatus Neomarinimicrobiota bacterium]MBT3732746.1 30S ribosomal protein S21 [Candidatus Neomarinimicrobiota bacterium]MBT4145028.1 30S ribosomal protein S21 [Candidatus Neomarinimicrobiota bacterium]
MVEVQVRDKESLERALRRFKKKWERAGVLRELRTNAFYIKPSDEKREAKKKAVRRMARNTRIEALRNNPRAQRRRRKRK